MTTAGKPARPTDPRIVQLHFPGTLRRADPLATLPANPRPPEPEPAQTLATLPPDTTTFFVAGPKKRAKNERVDWDSMQPHYQANKLSQKEIAAMYGVSAPAIIKHARLHGWVRNLSDQINARADELVNEASVNQVVNPQVNLPPVYQPLTAAQKNHTQLVISATAEVIANVRLAQRNRFSRAAELYTTLFVDLEQQVKERARLSDALDELMESDEENVAKLMAKAMKDAIALPEQIKAFKDLAAIGAQLTAQETTAYKLEKAPEGGENSRLDLPVRFVGTNWVERVKPEGETE